MSERTQRILWILEGIIAVCLAIATIYLYAQSRQAGQGYRIAYMSDRDGTFQIFTCNIEGMNTKELLEGQALGILPVCEHVRPGSGRESRIAFLRPEEEPGGSGRVGVPGGLYVVSSKGGEATKVSGSVQHILLVFPSWSPDGKQLVFAGAEDLNGDGECLDDEAGIYVCDVENAEAERVASAKFAGFRLSWSPMGPQVIVPVEQPDIPVPVACVLNVESGKLTPIRQDAATITACWSPDGQHIAAYSMADHRIHILQKDGSEEYAIDAPTGHVVDLLWVPARPEGSGEDGGRFLAVCALQPNFTEGQLCARSALPGSDEAWKYLTDDQTTVIHMAASPDGCYLAYTLRSGEGSLDLYVLELGQDEPRRLTFDPGFEGVATWIPPDS